MSVFMGNGSGGFASTSSFSVNAQNSLALGDVNGDGRPDIASPSSAMATTVSTYAGLPGGSFLMSPNNHSVGNNPIGVLIRDINGDQRPDLLSLDNGGSSISLLFATSMGTLAPAITYLVGAMPAALVVADMNGDGKPDVITANGGNDSVSILLNNGGSGLLSAVNSSTGRNPGALVSGDFNRDGKTDVVTVNRGAGTFSVLFGDGNNGFSNNKTLTRSTINSPQGIAAADFNGDGLLDLAYVSAGGSQVQILLGDGTGGFAAPVGFDTGGGTSALVSGDFDGNGFPDLLVGAQSASAVLMNRSQ